MGRGLRDEYPMHVSETDKTRVPYLNAPSIVQVAPKPGTCNTTQDFDVEWYDGNDIVCDRWKIP